MSAVDTVYSPEGRAAERRGNIAKAYEYYRACADKNPKSAEAWFDLGRIQTETGRLEDAEKSLRKGLAIEPQHQVGLWNLGRVLSDQEKYADALKVLNQAIEGIENKVMIIEEIARAKSHLGQEEAALVDCIRNAIMRHGFLWRTNIANLLTGACQKQIEDNKIKPFVVTKIEDFLVNEYHARGGSHFRERGPIYRRPGVVRLGFIASFMQKQTEFLSKLLPELSKAMPGLKIYAYTTRALPSDKIPVALAGLVEWRNVTGKLTYDAQHQILADELDVICDLDWGKADARTDISMTNPATIRMMWSADRGRFRITILETTWTDETRAREHPEWQNVVNLARISKQAWKNPQEHKALAQEFMQVITHAMDLAQGFTFHPYCSAGDTPPPIDRLDAQRKEKLKNLNVERIKNRSLDRWISDVRRHGFHFEQSQQSQDMRIAVLTPYTQEQTSGLEKAHRSVVEQHLSARHFLIGQGLCYKAADKWDVEHIVMPNDPDDLGLKALAIGARAAMAQGYNAIAFLPPGQRYRAAHLADMARASARQASELTMSRVALVGTHGRVFIDHLHAGNIPIHHDSVIGSFLVTGRALELMPLWAAIPRPARYFATGIFRSAVRARGYGQFMIANASIEVIAKDYFSFKRFSTFMPPDVLPLDFKEQALFEEGGTWLEWLSLLTATNSDIALPEPSHGILFDHRLHLTGASLSPKIDDKMQWMKSSATVQKDAAKWLNDNQLADAPFLSETPPEIATDKNNIVIRCLAHNAGNVVLTTSAGPVYPIEGLIAGFAEQGWYVHAWTILASSPDGSMTDYLFNVRRAKGRIQARDVLAA